MWAPTAHQLPDSQADIEVPVDRELLGKELRAWRSYNKALFSTNPRTALVPLDKPSVAAEILKEQMNPQAFGVLARTIGRLTAQKP